MSQWGARTDRARSGLDSRSIVYRTARGDDLEQNKILTPETIRMCMDGLATYSGDLAYTPEIEQKVQEVLERRYTDDQGNDVFSPPNYAPYDDPELASFYGIDTSQITNMQTRKENYEEQRNRLVKEVIREVEPELKGLWMQMEQFRIEDWARHGVADEKIYSHANPDVTLFRNYGKGWSTIDNPVSTSDKTNIIDLYEAQPEYTFPLPHPAWDVDRRGGVWNTLN